MYAKCYHSPTSKSNELGVSEVDISMSSVGQIYSDFPKLTANLDNKILKSNHILTNIFANKLDYHNKLFNLKFHILRQHGDCLW